MDQDELITQFAELTIDQVDEIPKETIEEIKKEIPIPEIPIPEKEKAGKEQIVKGTQRPDGSFRKDIKIRAGYKNAEMMGKYIVPQKR